MMFLYTESAFAHKLLHNDINQDVFPWQTLFWHKVYNNQVDYDIIKHKFMGNPQLTHDKYKTMHLYLKVINL